MKSIVALALVAGLAGCSHHLHGGGDADAVVIVHSAVDASLWVDGRYVGPTGALRGGVAVEPGPHRFELRCDDYFSYYAELELAPHERRVLEVELAPVLP